MAMSTSATRDKPSGALVGSSKTIAPAAFSDCCKIAILVLSETEAISGGSIEAIRSGGNWFKNNEPRGDFGVASNMLLLTDAVNCGIKPDRVTK